MRNGVHTLTEREKETLRLLAGGHDAKSMARHLGLSVHTINERLRDARRKLAVSSSREAARLLAGAEQGSPNLSAYERLGVSDGAGDVRDDGQTSQAQNAGHRLVWFGGGMLIMSLVIAAVIVSSALHGPDRSDAGGTQVPAPPAMVPDASASAGLGSARGWVGLVDRERWEESWRSAATLFRAQVSVEQWTSTIRSVRQPLGAVSARTFRNVTKASSLPGAPAGEYEVIQFQTDFAGKSGAVETVVLARDGADWKVTGYFIR